MGRFRGPEDSRGPGEALNGETIYPPIFLLRICEPLLSISLPLLSPVAPSDSASQSQYEAWAPPPWVTRGRLGVTGWGLGACRWGRASDAGSD